jgi:hypothetical protein
MGADAIYRLAAPAGIRLPLLAGLDLAHGPAVDLHPPRGPANAPGNGVFRRVPFEDNDERVRPRLFSAVTAPPRSQRIRLRG